MKKGKKANREREKERVKKRKKERVKERKKERVKERKENERIWFSLVWFGFMAHQPLLVI